MRKRVIFVALVVVLYSYSVIAAVEEGIDPYKVIEVEPLSDIETVKRAYKKLVAQKHPNKGGDTTTWLQIKAAYDKLINEDSKVLIDNHIRQKPVAIDAGKYKDFPSQIVLVCKTKDEANQASSKLYNLILDIGVEGLFTLQYGAVTDTEAIQRLFGEISVNEIPFLAVFHKGFNNFKIRTLASCNYESEIKNALLNTLRSSFTVDVPKLIPSQINEFVASHSFQTVKSVLFTKQENPPLFWKIISYLQHREIHTGYIQFGSRYAPEIYQRFQIIEKDVPAVAVCKNDQTHIFSYDDNNISIIATKIKQLHAKIPFISGFNKVLASNYIYSVGIGLNLAVVDMNNYTVVWKNYISKFLSTDESIVEFQHKDVFLYWTYVTFLRSEDPVFFLMEDTSTLFNATYSVPMTSLLSPEKQFLSDLEGFFTEFLRGPPTPPPPPVAVCDNSECLRELEDHKNENSKLSETINSQRTEIRKLETNYEACKNQPLPTPVVPEQTVDCSDLETKNRVVERDLDKKKIEFGIQNYSNLNFYFRWTIFFALVQSVIIFLFLIGFFDHIKLKKRRNRLDKRFLQPVLKLRNKKSPTTTRATTTRSPKGTPKCPNHNRKYHKI